MSSAPSRSLAVAFAVNEWPDDAFANEISDEIVGAELRIDTLLEVFVVERGQVALVEDCTQ